MINLGYQILMKNKIRYFLILLMMFIISIAVLPSCDNQIIGDNVTILDKTYIPSGNSLDLTWQEDKDGHLVPIYVPVFNEEYYLVTYGGKSKEGKIVVRKRKVDFQLFNELKVGDTIPIKNIEKDD